MKNIIFLFSLLILPACKSPKAQDNSTLVYKVEGKEIAYPRLSADGNQILYQSNQSGNWQLWIMDRKQNKHSPVLQDAYNNNFPDWSYDNEWIAFVSDRDGNEEIYLMRRDGGELKRITQDSERDIHPYFSPDGQYLLFNSTRHGSFDIFRYTISTGELKQLSSTPEDETCARFSPDMKHIVYLRNGASFDDIFMADSLNNNPVNVTQTPAINDGWPMFSYDNQWIYYSSYEKAYYNIYKIRTDGTGKKQMTFSRPGEDDARVSLSRDGLSFIYNKQYGMTIEIRSLSMS